MRSKLTLLVCSSRGWAAKVEAVKREESEPGLLSTDSDLLQLSVVPLT